MTADLDIALAATQPEPRDAISTVAPRRCTRHRWVEAATETRCRYCGCLQDPTLTRRGRNNRKRGNAAELDAARSVGGRKVGPLGHPWDVEMAGYARLQVRKYQTPQGLRAIAAELARIARAPGEEMPGYVWIEPGRGGERLVVFRLKDFAERHGLPSERTLEEAS